MKDALFIWVCIHSCFHNVCDRVSIMLVSNSLSSCLSLLRAGVIKYLDYRCLPPCSAQGASFQSYSTQPVWWSMPVIQYCEGSSRKPLCQRG